MKKYYTVCSGISFMDLYIFYFFFSCLFIYVFIYLFIYLTIFYYKSGWDLL